MSRYECEDCGTEIWTARAKRCKRCAAKQNSKTKIDWPSNADLAKMVDKDGYAKVGRKLGVSDSSIRKRLGRL